ncbi:NAD-dependent dehydratase [Sphaerisporangium rufum]|uniref:NAD-dependent dehydratase n=1 Tax=Sphaerisporangium rufum TaxID=1381558 RepID=A0A919UZQ2_9ACTN|nr:NAD-dependent epimerase/dehydratase family protein [Sphaerisporangium rufum]GII77999.1 NAD-dependent dehydratase [Sphaerisporangium rufum]
MKILLTGAAGFIGRHIATALTDAGHHVTPLDIRTGTDVRDPTALDRLLPGTDAVCHQAAKVGLGVSLADLPDYTSTNAHGTAVLLAAMARHHTPRLVLASSMVVYGEGAYTCPDHGPVRPRPRDPDDLARGAFDPRCPHGDHHLNPATINEDAPTDPRNAYATTKLTQEHLAATWARETGGTAIALRYHNVYGPHMPADTPYAGVAALFRSALHAGRPPRVFEDGAQRRDFIHVRDVAAANLAALTRGGHPATLTAYNIATGHPHTVGEMATALATAHGGPHPITTGEYRLGDVRHIVAAPDRARTHLGFTATIPFTDGITEFATAPLA